MKNRIITILILLAGLKSYSQTNKTDFIGLKTHMDFQLSFPINKYLDLYSYTNFIPGMGYKGSLDKWFPMLILNLKYRL